MEWVRGVFMSSSLGVLHFFCKSSFEMKISFVEGLFRKTFAYDMLGKTVGTLFQSSLILKFCP